MARRWAVLLAALSLGGCSATGVLGGLTASPRVETAQGLAYGSAARQKLDVYRPRGSGRHPVAVFLYGGAWQTGDSRDYRFVGQTLAREGVVTIVPDYRLYPQVRYPTFLQDCALAVRWVHDHAASYGGDPRRLFLMGHSAGAYNAVMLGLDARWLNAVGLDPTRDLAGVVGIAGPYDFLPLQSPDLKAIFGPEPQRPDTQPINHVTGRAPPLLLLADGGDKVVDPGNTTRLAARVQAAGGEVHAIVYPGLSHALMLGALAWPLRFLAPIDRDIMGVVHAHAPVAAAR